MPPGPESESDSCDDDDDDGDDANSPVSKQAPASSAYCKERLLALVEEAVGKDKLDEMLGTGISPTAFMEGTEAYIASCRGASIEERGFQCVLTFLPVIQLMNDRDFYCTYTCVRGRKIQHWTQRVNFKSNAVVVCKGKLTL